jgi:hypothetical protein
MSKSLISRLTGPEKKAQQLLSAGLILSSIWENARARDDFFFFTFIIHMCIQGLGHFSPLPHPLPYHPPRPLPLPPLNTQQKLFCPYF